MRDLRIGVHPPGGALTPLGAIDEVAAHHGGPAPSRSAHRSRSPAESERPFTTDEVAALFNVPLDTIRHYANPNKVGADPDIAVPAIAFTLQRPQAARCPHDLHETL
jgi:hypothetical protein